MLAEHYRQLTDLVAQLTAATEHNEITWEHMGSLGFVKAEYRGIRYILQYPQDGRPELIIDEVSVWIGHQLGPLWSIALDQCHRNNPPKPFPALPLHDSQIPRVIGDALETFKKK